MRKSHHGYVVDVAKGGKEFYEVIGIPIKANKVLITIFKVKEIIKELFYNRVNSISDEIIGVEFS
jgi:hypothetical protein